MLDPTKFVPLDPATATEADYICLHRRYKRSAQLALLLVRAIEMHVARPGRMTRDAEMQARVEWNMAHAEYLDAGGRIPIGSPLWQFPA